MTRSLALLCFGVTNSISACGPDYPMPEPISSSSALEFTTESKTIVVDGAERRSLVSVPSSASDVPLPVVFSFHADGGTGEGMRTALPIEEHATTGAVFVYPDAPVGTFDYSTLEGRKHEAAFVLAILDELELENSIDRTRVFLVGLSGGATMANALACHLGADNIRGVGIHSGTLFPVDDGAGGVDIVQEGNGAISCDLPAAMIVWGEQDDSEHTSFDAGQFTRDQYLATQGCGETTEDGPLEPCRGYQGCQQPVVWCPISGLGHRAWPNAAEALWRFVDQTAAK